MTPLSGREICENLSNRGIQLTAAALGPPKTLGAWLMDCAWTEAMCRLNIQAPDIEYKALPNDVYKAIPVEWPPSSEIYADIPSWNAVNTGNIFETYATCVFLKADTEARKPSGAFYGQHSWPTQSREGPRQVLQGKRRRGGHPARTS